MARGRFGCIRPTGQLLRYDGGELVAWLDGGDTVDSRSECRALVAEDSNLLWLGTDHRLRALRPEPGLGSRQSLPLAYRLPLSRLDFLLASKQGGYWRLANGHIQKCRADGSRTRARLAVSLDQLARAGRL